MLETLTSGSQMLLTLSRQAMAHPKLHIEAPVGRREIVEKENEEENLASVLSNNQFYQIHTKYLSCSRLLTLRLN
jgi:hypothetical protein